MELPIEVRLWETALRLYKLYLDGDRYAYEQCQMVVHTYAELMGYGYDRVWKALEAECNPPEEPKEEPVDECIELDEAECTDTAED